MGVVSRFAGSEISIAVQREPGFHITQFLIHALQEIILNNFAPSFLLQEAFSDLTLASGFTEIDLHLSSKKKKIVRGTVITVYDWWVCSDLIYTPGRKQLSCDKSPAGHSGESYFHGLSSQGWVRMHWRILATGSWSMAAVSSTSGSLALSASIDWVSIIDARCVFSVHHWPLLRPLFLNLMARGRESRLSLSSIKGGRTTGWGKLSPEGWQSHHKGSRVSRGKKSPQGCLYFKGS